MAPLNPRLIGWVARRACARALRRVGWGGLALGTLLAGATVTWTIERSLADDLVRAQQAAVIGSLQAATERAAGLARVRSPLDDLQAFEAGLPTEGERMQVLADLADLAERQELVLSRGEYQFQHDDKAGLDTFRITLPVKGDPASVQRFVQEALAMHRALAFDALALKRDQVDSGVVEAKVQLLLFMRREPGAQRSRSLVAGGAQ